jgi:RHS repeat-associated protein
MTDVVGTTAFTYTSFGPLAREDGPWDMDTVTLTYGSNGDCECGQGNHLRSGLSLLQPNASPWTVTYAYDNANRLQTLTAPQGAFTYSYQAGSLIKKLLMPNGAYITNTFDSVARRTATILDNSANSVLNSHSYVYNAGNQRTRQTRTDGSYVDYTYDNIGQLRTAIGKESGGSARLHENFGYAYDAADNLNYRTNNALVQTFAVDSLNQLSTVGRSGTLTVAGTAGSPGTNVTSVTVADNGNSPVAASVYADKTFARSGVSLLNGNNTFTAVAQDAYGRSDTNSVTVNLPSSVSYAYDTNGNLMSDGTRSFTYDDENELTNVSVAGSWWTTFVYDGRNRLRIRFEYLWQNSAWVLAKEVHYIYDGSLVIQERDGNNIPTVTYNRGLDLGGASSCSSSLDGAGGIGGLLARTDNSLMIGGAGDPHAYYHADANGNVTMLVNSKQFAAARYLYDSFGNTIAKSGPLADANTYRFSSKECHPTSGLCYFGRRFYDPNLQRWLNRDPIGIRGGVNLYGYVQNAPLNRTDAFGLLEDRSGTAYLIARYAQCDSNRDRGLLACAVITGVCYAIVTGGCIAACGGIPSAFTWNYFCFSTCMGIYSPRCGMVGAICAAAVLADWGACRLGVSNSQ